MSEALLIPEIEQYEGEQTAVEPEVKWQTMLDHETRDGDRFTVVADALHSFDPSAYRVNFVERGGERALGMLVQKAGWYDDSNMRWHREIVFGKDHGLYCDVQRQEWVYVHPSEDGQKSFEDKLFPVSKNP